MTEFNSEQLADSPTAGDVCTSDGEVNVWNAGAGLVNLDDAYNNSPSSNKTITVDDGEVQFINNAALAIFTDGEIQISATGNLNVDGTSDFLAAVLMHADLRIDESLYIKEQAAAGGDTAAYGQLWVKDTTPNELWFTDDAGTDFKLTARDTYSFGDPGVVPSTLLSNGVDTLPVTHSGVITRIEAFAQAWITVVATDTLTVILEYGPIGATSTTTITSTAGAQATFGADKAIAIDQGDILKVTTTISDNDTVTGVSCNVTIHS